MGTVITMYASATPAENMASIDVPAGGHMTGIDWSVSVAASGADFEVGAQISFGSTRQFSTNDARALLSTIRVGTDLTTSGAALTTVNKHVILPELPVNTGERIFLHGTGTAIVMTVNAALHFDFDLDRPRLRTR